MIHRFFRWYAHGYYRLCVHRSRRLRLPCYRFVTYDGYCGRHNDEDWGTS